MAGEDLVSQGKEALDGAVAKTQEVFQDVQKTVGDALSSPQAEEVSDSILDTVAGFAKKILPEDTHAKIDEVRDNVDGAIGS